MTTLGEIEIKEQTFKSARGVCRPFSEAAGVHCRGYSLLLQRRLTDFGADKSFDRAAQQVLEHSGVQVGASTVRRITEAHGQQLHGKAQLVQGAPSEGGLAQIVAEIDGSMIPIVSLDPSQEGDQRKARQIGWKEARLVLAYEPGVLEPLFGVSTGTVTQTGDQLGFCAARLGWDATTRVHTVGDGAPWIADQTERLFGAQGSYLVDLDHVCDYLAAASKGCAADHQAWYQTQKAHLKAGNVPAVLAALAPHLEPGEVSDDDAPVRACHRYLRNRPGQFDYPKALQAGLPIGSGKIESAHRYVLLCMLAYYLQWHMEQRLAPLFANDGEGQERRWTFRGVIDCLAQITRNKVTVKGAEFYQNSTPTPEQEEILDLLQVTM